MGAKESVETSLKEATVDSVARVEESSLRTMDGGRKKGLATPRDMSKRQHANGRQKSN